MRQCEMHLSSPITRFSVQSLDLTDWTLSVLSVFFSFLPAGHLVRFTIKLN